jgi:hypothetical protein
MPLMTGEPAGMTASFRSRSVIDRSSRMQEIFSDTGGCSSDVIHPRSP